MLRGQAEGSTWLHGGWAAFPLPLHRTLGSNPGRGLVARLVGHWDGRCFRELTINYLPSTSTVIHSILASTIYYHIDYELIFSFTLQSTILTVLNQV